MVAQKLSYEVDGTTFVGRLALPPGEGPVPAVLIAPEANGLDDEQAARAERLAALGYAALALDPHGGGRVLDGPAAIDARLAELAADPGAADRIVAAALAALLAEGRVDAGRVAAIGYCMGGTQVLDLARRGADLRGVVAFHPGLPPREPAGPGVIRGPVLVCVGSEDPIVPAADRAAFEREMTAAGADWRLLVLGGAAHSFTHPLADRAGRPGLAYHRPSAERAWRAMLDLLTEVFDGVIAAPAPAGS
ncbi:MAG: dienelactone hydrolase family protein [Acidimicrobiales bacterium]|nr:dienelactone hydrolase family protein [Acidimicrobiales bacterium]